MAKSGDDRPDMSYSKVAGERRWGLQCPECGCRDLITYGTKPEGSRIKRYRRCRACEYGPIITHETIAKRPDK